MKENLNLSYLTTITGNNFSGRTDFLRALLDIVDNENICSLYIKEQPNNFITGIFPTVKNEIALHSSNANQETADHINNLLFSIYNFEKHLHKNPFLLSGGEQAVLVILLNLLLQPQRLIIDTTLEQLNEAWRVPLLNAIQEGKFYHTQVFISDNRITEYNLYNTTHIAPSKQELIHKIKFDNPSFDYRFQVNDASKAIGINELSFSYDKSEVILDKINVYLEPRIIYHLKGANGAGKSTFAKILTGVLKISNGKIFVDEKEYDCYRYPGKLVGYSFQNPDEQLFSSSVEAEILPLLKKEPVEYSNRREIFLNMFGLQSVRKVHPGELPFVMRKRISLAATLAMDRPWYILDEPTLGQDDSFVEFLSTLLNFMTEHGRGIIIISHSESFIKALKIKSLILHDGKLN